MYVITHYSHSIVVLVFGICWCSASPDLVVLVLFQRSALTDIPCHSQHRDVRHAVVVAILQCFRRIAVFGPTSSHSYAYYRSVAKLNLDISQGRG